MNTDSAFTVAILSFNVRDKLRLAIESALRLLPGVSVRVWDNGSSDGTAEMVRQLFPSVTFHYSPENILFARGCNELVSRCTTPYVLLMNADIQLVDNSIQNIITFMEHDPSLVGVSPSVRDHGLLRHMSSGILTPFLCCVRDAFWGALFRDTRRYKAAMGENIPPDTTFPAAKITNCCCMLHRKAFLEIGGFCKRQLLYWTEEDFAIRVERRNMRQAVYGNCIVEHDHGSSTKKLPQELVRAIYVNDRITYMRTHFGIAAMLLVEAALLRPRFWKSAVEYAAYFSYITTMRKMRHRIDTFDVSSV